VLAIVALAAAIAVPVFSAMTSASAVHSAAGKVANFVNKRAALARSGGGPCEILAPQASRIAARTPEEASPEAAGEGAKTILGQSVLDVRSMTAKASPEAAGDEDFTEVMDLGDVTVDTLYVKASATGEVKDTLSVWPGGACDDALFVLSRGDAKAYVNVRGLTGRARVYDVLPSYLAGFFGVPVDETARGM